MRGHHGCLISQEVGGEHEGTGAGREGGTVGGAGRAGQGVEGKPRWQGELKAAGEQGPVKTPGSGTTVPQHVPAALEPPAVGPWCMGVWGR